MIQLHRLPALFAAVFPNEVHRKGGLPLVVANELEPKYTNAWKRLRAMEVELGDYLEFGVSRGTSMACMHRVVTRLKLPEVRLFGFDAFDGRYSESTTPWSTPHSPDTIEHTREFLNQVNTDWSRTTLVEGRFNDSLNAGTTERFGIRKASVVMINCHTYESVSAALNYSLPFIQDFAILFFDDWYLEGETEEARAYSEFLSENLHLRSKDFGVYRPTGRIFFVMNTCEC